MKKVTYCFTQKSMCSRKEKEHCVESRGMDFNTSSIHMTCELGQTTWCSVSQYPYLWIWTFTICLLLPTRMLQGANSTIHVQVLCKIKSHWLLNIAYLPVHAQPCFCHLKVVRELTVGVNLSHCACWAFVTRKHLHLHILQLKKLRCSTSLY